MALIEATAPAPWERQPGESARAFEAFCAYRDMGSARSVTKVAQELVKSHTLMSRWSGAFRWVDRVVAWDAELDRAGRAAQLAAIAEMNDRQARLARQAQDKLLERLASIQPATLTPADWARWLEVSTKLERLALGAATEAVRAEMSGTGGGPVAIQEVPAGDRLERIREIVDILREAGALAPGRVGEVDDPPDDEIHPE